MTHALSFIPAEIWAREVAVSASDIGCQVSHVLLPSVSPHQTCPSPLLVFGMSAVFPSWRVTPCSCSSQVLSAFHSGGETRTVRGH